MSKKHLKIYWIIITVLLPFSLSAQTDKILCSKTGYLIETINGIFTKEGAFGGTDGAEGNRAAVAKLVPPVYRGETLTVKYLYNPTRGLFGVIDLTDVAIQKTFEGVDMGDPDFLKMLNDASTQVKTQKLLLVAHSQGNFYANNFYEAVTKNGDVPEESISVYSVATPANYVAGNGVYRTSGTDTVINRARKVLPGTFLQAHDSINFKESDDSGKGHGFREIYLNYRGEEIKGEIEVSLSKLSTNPARSEGTLCINPPKALSTIEKVTNAVVYPVDATISVGAVALTARNNAITDEAIRKLPSTMFAVLNTYNTTVATALWTYNTTVATAVWTYNTAVATAKFVGDTTVSVASTVYDAVTGVLSDNSIASNNIASVILTTQDTQDSPSVTLETSIQPETSSQLAILQTTTSEPTSALFQLTQETSTQLSPTEAQTLSQNSVLPNTEILAVKSTATPQTETNQSSYGGGGGGSSPTAPVPQVDVTAPTITVIGDNPATTPINSEYVDAGATAADDVDGVISVASTSTVNTAILGSYLVTYTAVDASGNTATTSRAVNIVDTSAPEITINGTNPTTIEINSTYSDLGATASDAIDGARTVVTTSNVDTSRIGTYLVTYVASDLSQNTSTSTRTVNVVDVIEILPILFSDLNANGIADADESDVIATSTKSLTAGEYHFNNLTITNNATLTLAGDTNSSSTFKGVKIVATNITVNAGSHISADGQGYSSTGPGSGTGSIAASYGGAGGGNTATSTYGSATRPIDLGSGAGSYRGGGAMRIIATDTILNNGSISANGSGYRSSGGSVYITTNILTGDGTFTAKGSNASGWPNSVAGGGGRIAVHYQQSAFTGIAKANSGVYCFSGCNPAGGTGTVAFFDTANNDLYTGTSWRFQKNDEPIRLNRIIVSNGSSVTMDEGVAITASELIVSGATSLPLSKGSLLTIHKITVDGATIVSSGEETIVADILELTNSAVVTVVPMQTLTLSVPSVTIDAGSRISADTKGDTAGAGFPSSIYDGGSHGGVGGGNTATSTYGSAKQPTTLGSAGGAPHAIGGGAIRLVVSGTLVNNGIISANGNTSSSGGSIYATVANMSGSGTFHANGGNLGSGGYFSGPGGGGRVAIYYQTSSFVGTTGALGGCGSYDGWSQTCAENGTVGLFDTTNNNLSTGLSWRFQANDGASSFNSVTLSSGAIVTMDENVTLNANELQSNGASLAISNGSSVTIPTFIVNGGTVTLSGGETLTMDTLLVTGTSTISVTQGHPLVLSARDITISAGSSINVDGKGYSPTTGPGAPIEYYDGASYGGAGYNNSATSTYGSAFSPIDMGSGGNGHPSYAYGGGVIKITASGTLTINGAISANGGLTSSGGSVYLIADTFIGNGTISANGGGTYWSGYYIGPGGGGRIAIDSPSSLFSGSISASGTCYSSSGYIVGCSENGSVVYGASVASFDLATLSPAVQGSIDERAHTISLEVPYGTDVTAVAPTITVSRGASVSPASGEPQNFTDSVLYIVTSATSSTSTYAVTVTIAPEPDTIPPVITISAYDGITSTSTPIVVTATTSDGILNVGSHTFTENGSFDFIATDDAGNIATSTVTITNIDTSPPSIISYTFNETVGDITVDFATPTSVSFALTASENVNWVSIKIENQSIPASYKIFYSSTFCVDGTTTCVKSWDGTLSSGGGTAPNGIYRIKTNIRDLAGNIYQDYLSPYIITVNTVLP